MRNTNQADNRLHTRAAGGTTGFTRLLLLFCLVLTFSGCSALIGRAVSSLADSLTEAILNNEDIETVRDGVPAYLLMVDALVLAAPDNTDILLAASTLYGSYAGGFVEVPDRAKRLTNKSLDYALAALCRRDADVCDIRTMPIDAFNAWLAGDVEKNVELLYAVGVAWAGWVQAHADDWNAIGELARVRLLMEQVLSINETIDYGGPHLYQGVFNTLLPAALGGRPEIGEEHFKKAIELSDGRYLMTKVMYAKQYARLVYDRKLHDGLLADVLKADPKVPGITVINLLAQQQAKALLADADDYFF